MKLTVDRSAERHYGDQTGKRYFSISQVLKVMNPDQYAGIAPDVLERAAVKGTAVHHWFAKWMYSRAGICPAPAILPEYEGYCRAILMWADANKPDPIRLEQPAIWPGHELAGQPDLLCLYSLRRIPTLIELKTTAGPHRTHQVQVNIQRKLEGYHIARVLRVLYVHRDGSYDDVPVEPDPSGEAAFLNALTTLTAPDRCRAVIDNCQRALTQWRTI